MKEIIIQAMGKAVSVEVLISTRERLETMGLVNNIPEGEACVVALGRNDNGRAVEARVMPDIDGKRFLHGDDDYYYEVINEAKELLGL